MIETPASRHRALRAITTIAVFLPVQMLQAQHDGHAAMVQMSMDTLTTAPVSPSRTASDSARVADSLLAVCHPRSGQSLDSYSTCLGDGISALSSAGNVALAMGTLDRIVHSDTS